MSLAGTLFAPIQSDLERIEQVLADVANVSDPLLSSMLSEVLRAGGKRLRPALVLLVGRLNHYAVDRLINLAVATELLHTATLLHDDVVDQATRRRGRPALHTQVGNKAAVLVGDYMYGKSAYFATATGSLRVMQLFADCVMLMCQGQIEEGTRRDDSYADRSIETYFRTISSKTAALFVLACDAAAELSGASAGDAAALHRYGEQLGLAFQIIDDVLDIAGDEQTLGKAVGGDLRQRIVTLPVIYARDVVPAMLLREVYEGDGAAPPEESVQALLQAIQRSSALDRCYATVRQLVDNARRALEPLAPSPARDALIDLAEYVASRRA
ncbi:MAG: polyprenyl synthetase family protein [Chloroflexi bacterium]|nr:polyprenyl synthetase family protein [Chloroflexota bacterium]